VTPGAFSSQVVTPRFDWATISSLRALTRAMSMRTSPSMTTPKSRPFARRALPGARDQRLGRNAADIHAGAADALALEDCSPAARAASRTASAGAGLPGTG
jgi:hypothetical protein